MTLPFFYINEFDSSKKEIVLDEDTSRHVAQVLRMKEGEKLNLTDGKGNLITATITDAHKKHCNVRIEGTKHKEQGTRKITVAISLLKNSSRFEWFLEKTTEIGVNEIIPLICERTEKQKFRYDRMQGICISAMLQSQQVWLPVLHEPVSFKRTVEESVHQQKFIAYCGDGEKINLVDLGDKNVSSRIILIGPEGDFTKDEVDFAVKHHYVAVTLGFTRLRSETAGIVSGTLLKFMEK